MRNFISMELQQAIKNRRTIHSFNNQKVPEILVERSIEAANQAPCHRHTFPWRFTSIQKKERESLAELALELKFKGEESDERKKSKVIANILDPSHLIVVSQMISKDSNIKLEDYAACACAIQNMTLSLIDDGVGSKWSTGKITQDKRTYSIIGINPIKEEIIGFIWVGYGEIPPKINRPEINSIFRC